MDDARGVRGGERVEHLVEQPDGLTGRQGRALADDLVERRPSRYSMTRYWPMPGSVPKPKMSMMPRWRMALAARASANSRRPRRFGELGPEDLDGHLAADDGVLALVDDAHAPAADAALHDVPFELLAGPPGCRAPRSIPTPGLGPPKRGPSVEPARRNRSWGPRARRQSWTERRWAPGEESPTGAGHRSGSRRTAGCCPRGFHLAGRRRLLRAAARHTDEHTLLINPFMQTPRPSTGRPDSRPGAENLPQRFAGPDDAPGLSQGPAAQVHGQSQWRSSRLSAP